MSRFLFTSTPVEGHSASPLTIMSRLVETGHDVTWLAGQYYADRAQRAGVRHVPFRQATDYSGQDPFEVFPMLAGRSGIDLVRTAFRDVFIPESGLGVHDLQSRIAEFGTDVLVSSGPSYSAGLTGERLGLPVATLGDGPIAMTHPDLPPFGPGLQPWPGRLGRIRNRMLHGAARKMFGDVDRALTSLRCSFGLPGRHAGAFDSLMSPDLHLQGCVTELEYPMKERPAHVHFIGALRPMTPPGWTPPPWWDDLDGKRPIVHVTQGTIRPNVAELIRPTIDALAGEDVLVVATTGEADPSALGSVPPNVRATRFVPYELLLERAAVFVTNGGAAAAGSGAMPHRRRHPQ